jgi:hypothetical protein
LAIVIIIIIMGRQGGQGKGKPKLKDRNFGKALIKSQTKGHMGTNGRQIQSIPNLSSILDTSNLEDYVLCADMADDGVEVHRVRDNDTFLIEPTVNNTIQELVTKEFDYDHFHIDDAHSNIEKLEQIATGKIKDLEKADQRLKSKQRTESHPYEDIMDRYPDPDYANGGRVGYGSGGIGLPPISLPVYSDDETNVGIGTFTKNRNNEGRGPQSGFGIGANYGDFSAGIVSPFERGDFKKPELFLNWSKQFKKGGYVSKGEPVNTDLTRTIPPVKGPNPQGVETLFKKRYR